MLILKFLDLCGEMPFQRVCKMYTFHNSVRKYQFCYTFSQVRYLLKKCLWKIFNWYLIFVLISTSLASHMFFSIRFPFIFLVLFFDWGYRWFLNWLWELVTDLECWPAMFTAAITLLLFDVFNFFPNTFYIPHQLYKYFP